MDKRRKTHFDILKIIACFAVILQHNVDLSVSVQEGWNIQYLFYYIGRFAVPVFVMVSGALLLDQRKDIRFKDIFTRYIPRVVFPLIAIVYVMQITDMILTRQFTWKIAYRPLLCVLTNRVSVPYWYIYMVIGIYLMLPFLRKIVNNSSKKELEYFLVLFVGVRTIVPLVDLLLKTSVFNSVAGALMLNLFSGYIGLLVLGYYLEHHVVECKTRYLIIADVICVILPLIYVLIIVKEKYDMGMFLADIFSINMLLHSGLLFLIVKNLCTKTQMCWKWFGVISKTTFSVYILHVYVLQVFNLIGISKLPFGVFKIPLNAFLNFVLCVGITLFLTWLKKKVRRIKYAKE